MRAISLSVCRAALAICLGSTRSPLQPLLHHVLFSPTLPIMPYNTPESHNLRAELLQLSQPNRRAAGPDGLL